MSLSSSSLLGPLMLGVGDMVTNHWFLSLWGLCGVTPSATIGPGDVEGDDDGVVRGVFV